MVFLLNTIQAVNDRVGYLRDGLHSVWSNGSNYVAGAFNNPCVLTSYIAPACYYLTEAIFKNGLTWNDLKDAGIGAINWTLENRGTIIAITAGISAGACVVVTVTMCGWIILGTAGVGSGLNFATFITHHHDFSKFIKDQAILGVELVLARFFRGGGLSPQATRSISSQIETATWFAKLVLEGPSFSISGSSLIYNIKNKDSKSR